MSSICKISAKNEKEKNINFQFIRTARIDDIRKLKEIKGGRILLLYDHFCQIFDIKTGKEICIIQGKFEEEYPRYYDNIFYDFIELKNKDLIIWSKGKIFYYKKSGNYYEISQVINELKQQKNQTKLCQIGCVEIYGLYNIIEFENNILLSCNSIGIKIYNFIEKEYKLVKVISMFLDVENAIQIRDNNFLIIHHYTYHSGNCTPITYHKFALSLFDLKSKKVNKLFYQETEKDRNYRNKCEFNYFLLEDNFIYQICKFPYDIEDYNRYKKEKVVLSSNFNLYNIKTGNKNLNLKTSFRLISYFKDNLIFAQDYQNLHICYYENNTFTSIYKFNFNNSDLCILKNNDLIIFGEKKIWKEYERDNGDVFRSCIETNYYYNYYKNLSK